MRIPIPRDNGEEFIGEYQTIIDSNETNCDTVPGQRSAPGGRFYYSFELYAAIPGSFAFRQGALVLVIEFHDDRGSAYRFAETFNDLDNVKKRCSSYDPCQHLPSDSRSADIIEHVRGRYHRRLKRFVELIDEHYPAAQSAR